MSIASRAASSPSCSTARLHTNTERRQRISAAGGMPQFLAQRRFCRFDFCCCRFTDYHFSISRCRHSAGRSRGQGHADFDFSRRRLLDLSSIPFSWPKWVKHARAWPAITGFASKQRAPLLGRSGTKMALKPCGARAAHSQVISTLRAISYH